MKPDLTLPISFPLFDFLIFLPDPEEDKIYIRGAADPRLDPPIDTTLEDPHDIDQRTRVEARAPNNRRLEEHRLLPTPEAGDSNANQRRPISERTAAAFLKQHEREDQERKDPMKGFTKFITPFLTRGQVDQVSESISFIPHSKEKVGFVTQRQEYHPSFTRRPSRFQTILNKSASEIKSPEQKPPVRNRMLTEFYTPRKLHSSYDPFTLLKPNSNADKDKVTRHEFSNFKPQATILSSKPGHEPYMALIKDHQNTPYLTELTQDFRFKYGGSPLKSTRNLNPILFPNIPQDGEPAGYGGNSGNQPAEYHVPVPSLSEGIGPTYDTLTSGQPLIPLGPDNWQRLGGHYRDSRPR